MLRLLKIVAGIALLVTFQVGAEANPIRQTLHELSESDERVARIGLRLLTANAFRCSKLMPATGMVLHSLAQYRGPARAEAQALWRFPSPTSIAIVVIGSPAERAGLRGGDGLIAVASLKLEGNSASDQGSTALRDQAEQAIAAQPVDAPIGLTIVRDDQTLHIDLMPVPACRSRLEVVDGVSVKARSDGKTIQLGQAFVRGLSDEELAVVIAHELSHTILAHREQLAAWDSRPSNSRSKQTRKRMARDFEDAADLLSLQLLASAGWDPGAAPSFMRKHGRRFDPSFLASGVHRKAEDRARRMERQIVQMKVDMQGEP
jgi:Putative metallopeptidase domain